MINLVLSFSLILLIFLTFSFISKLDNKITKGADKQLINIKMTGKTLLQDNILKVKIIIPKIIESKEPKKANFKEYFLLSLGVTLNVAFLPKIPKKLF